MARRKAKKRKTSTRGRKTKRYGTNVLALEQEYEDAKRTYHRVGAALRKAHGG